MPRRPSSPSDREAVRVLAVSDETSEELLVTPDLVRSARLILACGDLPFDYLGALLNRLEIPLVFVPGNHDPDVSGYRSSRAGLTLQAGLPARTPWPDGALNADRRILDVAGLRVAGLGGCPRYSDGPNQYSERQQARRVLQLRGAARLRRLRDGRGVDVLITHAPPRGIGDGDDPVHRGFTALHGLTGALRPTALLHGHVHPYGMHTGPGRLQGAVVYNVTGWHLLEIRPGLGMAELHPVRDRPGGPVRSGWRAFGHRDAG
jgi:Icc-related predicted phosphoesterase